MVPWQHYTIADFDLLIADVERASLMVVPSSEVWYRVLVRKGATLSLFSAISGHLLPPLITFI